MWTKAILFKVTVPYWVPVLSPAVWTNPSETNSLRKSGGAFEKESYSYTPIKFKATISSNGLFWIFGAKCEQSDWQFAFWSQWIKYSLRHLSRTSNCILVERGPLLPTQKGRSPMLTLCHANVRTVHMHTGRGASGAAASPNFGRLRFFGQQEKFGQSQFLKTFPCFFLLV